MTKLDTLRGMALGTALAAALAAGLTAAIPAQAIAQSSSAPANDMVLSAGTGRLVQLPAVMTDVFVANDDIADVQVRSNRQIYIFGKSAGQTTVHATDRNGRVIYSTSVRVGQNLASVDQMLNLAMPEASITATPMNGLVLLTGTVAQPSDAAEAERLVQAFVGEGTQVLSRLRTATPQQVMLHVKIAEVSRNLVREIGTNLLSRDTTGGFLFGIGRGNAGSITTVTDPVTGLPATNFEFHNPANATTLGFAGRLLGLDVLSTLNLAEQDGLVTTLAEPTLTALSGETASFLAGGEFPIPVSQSLGTVTIEYKQYGVGLAFSPIVLENGRISIRVRPEVSELSTEGSIRLNDFDVPALTTRRAETTIELGSGQSFMIGGLLRNHSTNSIDRAPFLGNLPIIGALFRSTRFRRAETELVIVVTPYLVNPVNASQIALPTDGFRNATDAQRVLGGQLHDSRGGETRPIPRSDVHGVNGPALGGGELPGVPAAPVQQAQQSAALPPAQQRAASPQPGFDFD